jgi:hypothetical protein
MRDRDDELRRFTFQSFNREAALARTLGAAFSVSTLFAPMLERHQLELQRGEAALRVVAPDLGRLPWVGAAGCSGPGAAG